MTRRGYDAAVPGNIPLNLLKGQVCFPYVDGEFATPEPVIHSWVQAGATIARISVIPPGDPFRASVLDVERGAARPADAPRFIRERAALGHLGVVYVNRSNRAEVESRCRGLPYFLWVATLDGTRTVADMERVVAVQDISHAGRYDESVVYADWWHPVGGYPKAGGHE